MFAWASVPPSGSTPGAPFPTIEQHPAHLPGAAVLLAAGSGPHSSKVSVRTEYHDIVAPRRPSCLSPDLAGFALSPLLLPADQSRSGFLAGQVTTPHRRSLCRARQAKVAPWQPGCSWSPRICTYTDAMAAARQASAAAIAEPAKSFLAG